MKPKVSIITPTYNHEKFIAACIESVLAQTYPDWEMIIVDDGSTDATADIVGKYCNDRRIKFLRHGENYGKERLAETHNEAFSLARGDFVTVLEGDDYWPDYRLKLQLGSFLKSDAVLSHGEIAVDRQGLVCAWRQKWRYRRSVRENDPLGSALKVMLTGASLIFPQSALMRREILEKMGGFKQHPSLYLVDYSTFMEFALHGKFVFMPEIMGFWRKHSASITANFNDSLWLGVVECAQHFAETFRGKIKSLPAELEVYLDNPGAYAYGTLYKRKVLGRCREKDARKFFVEAWKRRATLPFSEKVKILVVFHSAKLRLTRLIYRVYIKMRSTKISVDNTGK